MKSLKALADSAEKDNIGGHYGWLVSQQLRRPMVALG